MRFLYTLLGIAIALSSDSFYLNYTFNGAFSRSARRIYELGCGRGLFIVVGPATVMQMHKCYIISEQYEQILLEILDQ